MLSTYHVRQHEPKTNSHWKIGEMRKYLKNIEINSDKSYNGRGE